ncbi:DUF4767 domain-containing protein [Latilactobacillus sakei]
MGACSVKGEQQTKSTSTSHSKKVTAVTSSQKQVRKETTSSVSQSKKQSQPQTQTKQVKALWDSNKKQALATFMSSWGTTMGQTYQSYDLTRDTNYARYSFSQ